MSPRPHWHGNEGHVHPNPTWIDEPGHLHITTEELAGAVYEDAEMERLRNVAARWENACRLASTPVWRSVLQEMREEGLQGVSDGRVPVQGLPVRGETRTGLTGANSGWCDGRDECVICRGDRP